MITLSVPLYLFEMSVFILIGFCFGIAVWMRETKREARKEK